MLPEPAAGGQLFQAGSSAQCLRGIADQDVILHGPVFERRGEGSPAGLRDVDENVAASA